MSLVLVLHAMVATFGLWLSVIDQKEHRLPNALTAPLALGVGIVALLGAQEGSIASGLLGSTLSAGTFALLALLPSRPLGWGDVKLQAILGFYLDSLASGLAFVQAILSFVLGGIVATVMIFRHRGRAKDPLAFGPAMVGATLMVIVWAQSGQII